MFTAFEPVFIDDQSVVPDLLLSGEIDAFIEEGTLEAAFDAYGFIKAEEYYPLTYSPISLTSGNPEMIPLINIMQKYLKNGGYFELTELYNQGYKDYLKHKLSKFLTDEEKSTYKDMLMRRAQYKLPARPIIILPAFITQRKINFRGWRLTHWPRFRI